MRCSNFTPGKTPLDIIENLEDLESSHESPENRHVSPLNRFTESQGVASLVSYEPSPREDDGSNLSITPNKTPEGMNNFAMSLIYSTMKVNKTPIDDKGNKIAEKFPPVELMEELEQKEGNLQTFDLITYDKGDNSVKSFASSKQNCSTCANICHWNPTNTIANFNPINEIYEIAPEDQSKDFEKNKFNKKSIIRTEIDIHQYEFNEKENSWIMENSKVNNVLKNNENSLIIGK